MEGRINLRKLFLMVTIIFFLLTGFSASVRAGSQDFYLVNQTGVDIYNLYISPSDSDTWGDDRLGSMVLVAGANIRIIFNNWDETYWDIKITDQNGRSLYWQNLNLKRISILTICDDGVRVWVEWK